MRYWLMKSEPDEFSIDDLARAPRRGSPWYRRAQLSGAQFHARPDAKSATSVLFYHSSCPEPGIAGLAEVCAKAYPDATQFDPKSKYYDAKATREQPRWVNVDVQVRQEDPRSSAWPNCAGTRNWPACACSRAATACPSRQSIRTNGSSSPPDCSNKMTKLKNDTLIRALLRQPTEYTPVWLMRQAGRYLPEYNQTRSRAGSFLGLCKNPGYATEVTLQPLARFELDAAILFSDILTVPDAMGLGLYFAEGEGPKFERPLRDEWAIRDLAVPDPGAELRYVIDAVSEIRRALGGSVPLIGFSGSPYTLACYMVEGGGKRRFPHRQDHALCAARLAASHSRSQCTGRDRTISTRRSRPARRR